jgi:hypothetical protein
MSLAYSLEGFVLHVAPEAPALVQTAAQVFTEELERRTGWPSAAIINEETTEKQAGVWLGTAATLPPQAAEHVAGLAVPGPEGYRLCTWAEDGHACAVVEGADERGVYYGMGRLLRMLLWKQGEARLPGDVRFSSTPRYAIRGHQLGYRPKTNAYDAWTPEIYDRYLRELALFGVNSVELLPPHTDDDLTGPLMKVDPLEMIGILSEKAHRYGMDVWVWYPDMAEDYGDPQTVQAELDERRTVFERMPYLDHLFVPGGDPGELDPEPLFGGQARDFAAAREPPGSGRLAVAADLQPQPRVDGRVLPGACQGTGMADRRGFRPLGEGPGRGAAQPHAREVPHPQLPGRRAQLPLQFPWKSGTWPWRSRWDANASTRARGPKSVSITCISPRSSEASPIRRASTTTSTSSSGASRNGTRTPTWCRPCGITRACSSTRRRRTSWPTASSRWRKTSTAR